MTAQQVKAKELIGNLIPWGDHDFTGQEWDAYLSCAQYLQQMDEHDLISLFEIIQDEYIHDADGDKMQSRLFILLRILFKLPLSGDPSSRRSFKGWENWPISKGTEQVNIGWPVHWKDNHPFLEDRYEGSLGKAYALVQEYEYFKSIYRYRNLLK